MASWLHARQWLFSLKAFAAAMLALYLALYFGLARPYWAMATVYFVSNPLTGATRSKAVYRVAGTVLGAAAAVVTVPLLVNMPIVMMGAIGLWIAVLVYLSMLQRSPRGYVFLLAAYTLPIVALPAVMQPAEIFGIAVARIEEIVIGIVCAALVGAIVFPAKVAPALRARARTWLDDAAIWADDIARGHARARASRHRMAADMLALDQLIEQLAFDAESRQAVGHARNLRARMSRVIPVLSGLDSVLHAMRAQAQPAGACPASPAASSAGAPAAPAAPAVARSPSLTLAPSAAPVHGVAPTAMPRPALEQTAAHLQRRYEALMRGCMALERRIGEGDPTAAPTAPGAEPQHEPVEPPALHHDHVMLGLGALSAGLAVFCSGMLWILSGWEDGGGPVAISAVASCFFAMIDEPRQLVRSFMRWSAVCLAISSFYLFLVVPHAHNFETLVGMLALPYLGIGMLITRPGFNLVAMLLSVNTASFAPVQSGFDANFLGVFNTNLANAAAMLFAPLWAVLARPFGAHVAAHRLIHASWQDLARAATWRAADAQAGLGARMLDRLGQLMPRLGAAHGRIASDGFTELQIGYCTLALQRALPGLSADARKSVRRVLGIVARHFRAQARSGHITAVPPSLHRWVEAALVQIAALPDRELVANVRSALVVLAVTLRAQQTGD